ncbi:unnamed protein product [Adineta ricciae]|uniref:Uncharacterized protein n=1 Tax=Adineta ricciae TaxID=249248 RepID=A0A814E0E4_ADIRI|nr:unnamed protein product [Adineta ricciae]CAF0996018.1 unnamed protein product [Adineta ricciae]
MSSSTLLNSSIVVNSSTSSSDTANDYDYEGAAIYIAAILIWYSAGLVLMLFFRVRPRTFESRFLFDYETSGKSASSNANPFARYHDIQADNLKKQILYELKDPENRQRLWKIYYASAEKQNEPHAQYYQTITADSVTIGHINRKLADIHRMNARKDMGNDDDVLPTTVLHASHDNRFDTSKFFSKRFTSRRSSFGSLHNRRPIFRVSSQPQTPITTTAAQGEAPTVEKTSTPLATNGSHKRSNNHSIRFTVEKVPETNRKCSAVAENIS